MEPERKADDERVSPDTEPAPDDESSSPPPSPSVLDHVADTTRVRPGVTLREPPSAAPVPKPPGPGDPREAGKYVVQGELGRGGVGAVHRGHDQDLGRDVAIKFLHDKYRDHPSILHRFVEEAQIGGQLQHPGVVPVYDLGMSEGKPFFAMKLIKGQTLAKLLADRESPAVDRRGFLAIFEQVCQTMAYAHARGVVHRDLKPANVMIGAFGEVQVVDWGMGKVLPAGDVADERRAGEGRSKLSVIETVRTTGSGTQSVMGSVMGTPAYMPPEQAIGQVDQMDERSDVFALGAILCEILTGEPPYLGGLHELLEMAAKCSLSAAFERLDACGADPTLIDLAKTCLRPAPEARPKSAEVVATRVHGYLGEAEKAVHAARVTAAEERVRAQAAGTRQRLAIGLVVVVAVGLAASLWFWKRADEQRVLAELSAKAAVHAEGQAKAAQAKERTARDDAEANLANFNRLSYVVRLEDAKARAASIGPAWPENAEALRAWLEKDARKLSDALPELRATLEALERKAKPNGADTFLRKTLRALIDDIGVFAKQEVVEVERGLAWAGRVEELTIERYRDRWEKARIEILRADGVTASKSYAASALELKPQMGLVPIGMNPRTKLWEFYHVRSGWDLSKKRTRWRLRIPKHRRDGTLQMNHRGMVFVLVPGGKFFMGTQKADPDGKNYDPASQAEERPVHEVDLAPYFISRYELTQGQWARLTGGTYPSALEIGTAYPGTLAIVGDSHPVEQVSWEMCNDLLEKHGLILPTESQWERACRAGGDTPWFTGKTSDTLYGYSNVLDKTGQAVAPPWPGGAETFDDRYKPPAPVGTYAANDFGLHDAHGNVWEWCQDWYGSFSYAAAPRAGDGLREPKGATKNFLWVPVDKANVEQRVARGGSCQNPGGVARSGFRHQALPTTRWDALGVRPARRIQP